MPREARYILPGIPLHVVQRGINRSPCFFSEADYPTYLYFLHGAIERYGCALHAYCMMTNHVHLLFTPSTPDACGAFMKHVGQCYVQTINKRLGRTGTLWEGRFRSCPVQSDSYVLACYRYIDLNPVRAGMVPSPEQYPWSSYLENAGAQPPKMLSTHGAYENLGRNRAERSSAYSELCSEALPLPVMEEIRKATRLGCVTGSRRRGRGRPFTPK